MKKLITAALFLCAWSISVLAQSSPPIRVTEADGSPSKLGVTKFVFDNGTVTITGNTARVTGSGGGGGAPTDATYITQTANGSLSAEQPLSVLSSGIMRVATTTGVVTSLTDSAGIAGNISDETGSGVLVFATSPTLVTPVLGVAAATTINKVALTAPATGATLTIADGKTLTASNTLTFTGTDSSSVAFGGGGTVAYAANNLSVFAATTSAELAGVISNETGTGALVFAGSPALTGTVTAAAITTTGAVGVGAAPSSGFKFGASDGTSDNLAEFIYSGNDTTPVTFQLRKTRGAVVQSGDGLGRFFFSGFDGSVYRGAAGIRAEVDGTPGSNDMPGRLLFQTAADGTSTLTERMRIDNAGNIGFGTSSFGTSAARVMSITNGATAPSTSPADVIQAYGGDAATGAAELYTRNEAGEVERQTGLAARVSTQFDKTNTTLATVTGLSRNVESGRTYTFRSVLHFDADLTGGSKFAIEGTATATSVTYEIVQVCNASNLNTITSRQTALAGSAGQAGCTAGVTYIDGTIVVNAGGTLIPSFAQNAASGTSSVLVNSSFVLHPIS